jgi:glycosyltransferase involved in cell wall biosynthesis
MGIEVLYGTFYAQNWKEWLKNNGKFINYVFLNRPHISINYIDEVRKYTNAKVFYYGHDLQFLREFREYHLTNDKLKLQSSKETEKIEFSIMNMVDFSYYPSQIEVDEIRKKSSSICVKTIPAYLFENKQNKERNFENTKDIMFIGGFQHKPNIDGILWYVREIYPVLNERRPDINTYILGSNAPNEVLRLNSEKLIVKGFITDEQLLDYYRNCRLSIVPLRYGAGIKGKIIEAMYNQIPVIITFIGAEGIKGAENFLFIKDDPVAFAEEIINIYDDHKLLSEISIKEIEVINEEFTTSAAIKAIKDDFNL